MSTTNVLRNKSRAVNITIRIDMIKLLKVEKETGIACAVNSNYKAFFKASGGLETFYSNFFEDALKVIQPMVVDDQLPFVLVMLELSFGAQ